MVSGGNDGYMFSWDMATGQSIHKFGDYAAWIFTVAISPDDTQVVSGFQSGVQNQAIVLWDVATGEEKSVITRRLSRKLTREGVLILSAQESRSQLDNKVTVIAKLEHLLAKAFEKKKVRKPTRPSKGAARKRVNQKKAHGEKKKWRRGVSGEE